MGEEPKTACRSPAPGRNGVTNIPTWKYTAIRAAILEIVRAAGPNGVTFSQLPAAVRQHLTEDELKRLGSVGWHTTTVKLNMEIEGEISRVAGVKPQCLILG